MKRIFVLTALVLAALFLIAAVPPGNNGTVFINGISLDGHEQPHVKCVADLEARGFDPNQKLDWSFEWQSPTSGGALPNGTLTVDKQGYGKVTINLEPYFVGVTPHPIQGYHLKLNVVTHQPGDQKHKVFWAQCKLPDPTPTATATKVPPTLTATATKVRPTKTAPATATKVRPTKTPTATKTSLPNTPTSTATSPPGPTNTPTVTATNPPCPCPTDTAVPKPTPTDAPKAKIINSGAGIDWSIFFWLIVVVAALMFFVTKRKR